MTGDPFVFRDGIPDDYDDDDDEDFDDPFCPECELYHRGLC